MLSWIPRRKADQIEQRGYDRGQPPSIIDSGYRMLEERKTLIIGGWSCKCCHSWKVLVLRKQPRNNPLAIHHPSAAPAFLLKTTQWDTQANRPIFAPYDLSSYNMINQSINPTTNKQAIIQFASSHTRLLQSPLVLPRERKEQHVAIKDTRPVKLLPRYVIQKLE